MSITFKVQGQKYNTRDFNRGTEHNEARKLVMDGKKFPPSVLGDYFGGDKDSYFQAFGVLLSRVTSRIERDVKAQFGFIPVGSYTNIQKYVDETFVLTEDHSRAFGVLISKMSSSEFAGFVTRDPSNSSVGIPTNGSKPRTGDEIFDDGEVKVFINYHFHCYVPKAIVPVCRSICNTLNHLYSETRAMGIVNEVVDSELVNAARLDKTLVRNILTSYCTAKGYHLSLVDSISSGFSPKAFVARKS